MTSDWTLKKLSECCRFQEGYVNPSQNHPEYFDGDIKWIRAVDLTNSYVYNTTRTLTQAGFLSAGKSAKLFNPNTIVISKSGTIGRLGIIKDYMCGNRATINIEPREGYNLRYIFYLLLSHNKEIADLAVGSVQKNLYVSILENLEYMIPPLDIQCKIVQFLASIDDKIDVNTRINDNLQQQALAIYNERFIANADPAWTTGHLSDLVVVRYGKDHKKLADGLIPVYGSGGLMRRVERALYDKESVLIPRKGSLNNVMYINEPFWSVDTMFYTEMLVPNVAKFVYHFVSSKDLASMNAGSAVPSMTTDILNAMELQIPDEMALADFESVVAPMYRAIQENRVQSEKLAAMRDSLLPRLMSGKMDVSNVKI